MAKSKKKSIQDKLEELLKLIEAKPTLLEEMLIKFFQKGVNLNGLEKTEEFGGGYIDSSRIMSFTEKPLFEDLKYNIYSVEYLKDMLHFFKDEDVVKLSFKEESPLFISNSKGSIFATLAPRVEDD